MDDYDQPPTVPMRIPREESNVPVRTCRTCGGTGKVKDYSGRKGPVQDKPCDTCEGTGKEIL